MTETELDNIVLTPGQAKGKKDFISFLLDREKQVFVIQGYSGCGKSTLVRQLLECIPEINQTFKLLDPHAILYEVELTATTNKAAENLGQLAGSAARTVHSALGLRVNTDYKTGKTTLSIRPNAPALHNVILFIDEASYVDSDLLGLIFKQTKDCKIVFIGDPGQLTQFNSTVAPVFKAGFEGCMLDEVVRQAEGNPIIELSTMFRHAVNTGEFGQFNPDGKVIQHLSRDDFNAAVLAEFTRPEWKYGDSMVLSWTNKTAIGYNNYIRQNAKGDPDLQVGDYATCNTYVQIGKEGIKTDQTVFITGISPVTEIYGVEGRHFHLNEKILTFMPLRREDKKHRLNQARRNDELNIARVIEDSWIDLRPAYAGTVNKAQGSTYDRVFVDLDDILKCNSGNQIARMLYVAISRARYQVFLTGDVS